MIHKSEQGKTLSVVDFRSDTLDLIPILTNIPKDAYVTISSQLRNIHLILGDKGMSFGENRLKLEWQKDPKVEYQVYSETFESSIQPTNTQIVGKAWLETQLDRLKLNLSIAKDAPPLKDDGKCENEGVCGRAKYFPSAPNLIYIASQDCGDFCYIHCAFMNKKTGETKALSNCGPYLFSQNLDYYGNENSICDLNSRCRKVNGKVIGILRSTLQINF